MAWSQSLACRTETRTNDIQSEQLPFLVRLRDGSEIFVKCHVQRENLGPFPCKNVLSVRFSSNDSGTPGEQIDDADLSRVSPLAHRHVIPNGTYFHNQAVGDPNE